MFGHGRLTFATHRQKWGWLPKSSEEHQTFCEAFIRPAAFVLLGPWQRN
jgi:hypothetical protein